MFSILALLIIGMSISWIMSDFACEYRRHRELVRQLKIRKEAPDNVVYLDKWKAQKRYN